MQLALERRTERAAMIAIASPLIAIALTLITMAVLFAILGWWDPILGVLGLIDIHVNGLGYLSLSVFIFAIWLLTYLVYDRRNRMIFGRGQLRIQTASGHQVRLHGAFRRGAEGGKTCHHVGRDGGTEFP